MRAVNCPHVNCVNLCYEKPLFIYSKAGSKAVTFEDGPITVSL